MLFLDGSNNVSPPAPLGDAPSQPVHHYHSAVYHVQISVTPGSVQNKPEQLSLDDTASKLLLKMYIVTIYLM